MSTRISLGNICDLHDLACETNEGETFTASFDNFVVRQTIEEVIGIKIAPAAIKGIEILYKFSRSLPQCLLADRARIQQMLFALLNNAIQFTPRGG